eukprot:gnl/Dysnectes_brevis/513_a569_6104.p1 GENE.gnl/Dysnectes_brevis/513_a569_6104~~gnl/Dysnectes_brevis/513_a569_6104.p1  ORF type:complete len:181 (+),score=60.32 gnl/Dysnectes_brevis/513_a569_6104:30-572(+)
MHKNWSHTARLLLTFIRRQSTFADLLDDPAGIAPFGVYLINSAIQFILALWLSIWAFTNSLFPYSTSFYCLLILLLSLTFFELVHSVHSKYARTFVDLIVFLFTSAALYSYSFGQSTIQQLLLAIALVAVLLRTVAIVSITYPKFTAATTDGQISMGETTVVGPPQEESSSSEGQQITIE